MNAIFSGIFSSLWPGLIKAVEDLITHAKSNADAGNHDVAHAALSAAAGLAAAGVAVAGEVVPALVGVQIVSPTPVTTTEAK